MCKELGTEPIPEEIPIDYSDFPPQVQQAILIYNTLPEDWEGFSGVYLGKNFTILEFLMNLFEVDDKPLIFKLISTINNIVINIRAEEHKKKQKTPKKGKK